MRRVLLITNPASGSASADVHRELAAALAREADLETVQPGSLDAFDAQVQAAAAGRDLVVVAGGDGTFNCTVNALAERLEELTFGLVPMGTGNDLASHLGLPSEPEAAAEIVLRGAPKRLDVGRASGAGAERLFVNACIGGFPVAVDEALDDQAKERLGRFAFVWGGLKAVRRVDPTTVTMNGTSVPDCVVAGVGNGATAGGGIPVWPEADPGDGLLEAVAMQATGVRDLLALGARVRLAAGDDSDLVTSFRAHRVEIDSEGGMELNVDGELVGLRTPAVFEIASTTRVMVAPG